MKRTAENSKDDETKKNNELIMYKNKENAENTPSTSHSPMVLDNTGRIKHYYMHIQNQLYVPNNFNHNIFMYNQPTVINNRQTLVQINTEVNQVAVSNTEAKPKVLCSVALESSVDEVGQSLSMGCFCVAKNCFSGLDPESVYQHRLRLSKLDQAQHNMFLMGVLVTCFTNMKRPTKRMYIKYCYNSKRVCKEAFLYLHLCTYQQLAVVKEHLLCQGVSTLQRESKKSRKQDDYFKSAHNTVRQFLSQYLRKYVGKTDIHSKQPILLPFGATKKNLHEAYKLYICQHFPGNKPMGFVMFRDYLFKYFPHVIFYKFDAEPGSKPKPLVETQWLNCVRLGSVQSVSPYSVIPPHHTYKNRSLLKTSHSETSTSTSQGSLNEHVPTENVDNDTNVCNTQKILF